VPAFPATRSRDDLPASSEQPLSVHPSARRQRVLRPHTGPSFRDAGSASSYPEIVIASIVALSVIGLALLIVLGTFLYAIALAVGGALMSLLSDVRDRFLPRSSDAREVGPAEIQAHGVPLSGDSFIGPSEPSIDAMWQRMQGTSKKSRRRKSSS
jgi:hypothetical protein